MSSEKLTAQQQAVVDYNGGTLLVSAAAGSGKTKVLVDRVLRRITVENQDINHFLIITFTKAAASELRAKIITALQKALAENPGNKHLQKQMNLVQLAQISTIHSFCSSLLRQYGYEIGVASDFRILDETAETELLADTMDAVLNDAYKNMTPDFRALADSLGAGRDDQKLIGLVKELYNTYLNQCYPEKWMDGLTLGLADEAAFEQCGWVRIIREQIISALKGSLPVLDQAYAIADRNSMTNDKMRSYFAELGNCMEAMIDGAENADWDDLSGLLKLPKTQLRFPTGYDEGEKEHIKSIRDMATEPIKKLTDKKSMLIRPAAELFAEINAIAPALQALCALVRELDSRFSAEKRRRNSYDYSDLEHLTIRLLTDGAGTPTPLAREISTRYCEIMVDEYQDSNRIQELIFSSISADGDSNRFLVGDVKQSIYGFRQAEPRIFMNLDESFSAHPGPSGKKLILSNNFRSRPEVLDAVNFVFETVMSETVGDVTYDSDVRLYPGLGSTGYPDTDRVHVGFTLLDFPKDAQADDDTDKYRLEAQWTANQVVKILRDKLPVRDGETIRPAEPGDIAILLRANSSMGAYRNALERCGIPVASGGGQNLFDYPEIRVLVNMLRAIDNPHQDIPLLSVLCSPLYRISNDQLALLKAGRQKKLIYDLMADSDDPALKSIYLKLRLLRRQARILTADRLIWKILNEEQLLTVYAAAQDGKRSCRNLMQLYELASSAASDGNGTLHSFIKALDLWAEGGRYKVTEESSGVNIVSMHSSKGLEYPIVILSELSREFHRDSGETMLVDAELGIGAKYTNFTDRTYESTVSYEAVSRKQEIKDRSEELRILYVAMTRAKDYLFMSCAKWHGLKSADFTIGAGHPVPVWSSAKASRLGWWLLLSAIIRKDGGALREVLGGPHCPLVTSEYPWDIRYEQVTEMGWEHYSAPAAVEGSAGTVPINAAEIIEALSYEYPYSAAETIPSKVTATQLKGRNLDEEAAEETVQIRVPRVLRPSFILEEHALTPTEKGTAAHLFMQYADYSDLSTLEGVESELLRLVDYEYITQQQADAVNRDAIVGLFNSGLGAALRDAEHLIREFKFSLLTAASDYFRDAENEEILLQGVVDAAIIESDGITVIDFKTDRVTDETLPGRVEEYKNQLETYRKALEKIMNLPVKHCILAFLTNGRIVEL